MSIINTKEVHLAAYVEAALPDGQVLLKVLYIGLDASLKLHMDKTGSMIPPSPLHKPMLAVGIGRVVATKSEKHKKDDLLLGYGIPWAEYAFVNPMGLETLIPNHPLYYYLGLLGFSGITAYYGLLDITDPKANEVVVVSTAAGAVGYVVGQLAKMRGCKVIGITGSETKAKVLQNKLKFDAIINYKTSSNIKESLENALKSVNPENPKIDVYFDNVGGETLNAVLALLNQHARVSLCGATSEYNHVGKEEKKYPITNMTNVVLTKSKVIGFNVGEYWAANGFPVATAALEGWLKEGKLISLDDVVSGLDKLPEAAVGMMRGDNVGKRTVKVGDE